MSEEIQKLNQQIFDLKNKRDELNKSRTDRAVTPDPRTFESFPEKMVCPICGTNNDGTTILIPIEGTGDGNIVEAKAMHLSCAIIKSWSEEHSLGVVGNLGAALRQAFINTEKNNEQD